MLHLAVQVLQQFLPLDFTTLPTEDHALLTGFLELLTQLLNWNFKHVGHKMFRANPEAISVTLRPPMSYAPTFLDRSFLYLFFQLLAKVKSSETDYHHVVQCLTQLSSLTVLSSDNKEEEYLMNFVGGVLEYVSSRYKA